MTKPMASAMAAVGLLIWGVEYEIANVVIRISQSSPSFGSARDAQIA